MDPVPALYVLLYALLIVGVAAKPSPQRWIFFLPIAVIATLLSFNSSIEAAFGTLLAASDFLLLTNVQRELRLVGQQKSISGAPLWERLKWAVKLITGLRGIGWAHEPTAALPARPTHLTRLQFIASRLKWLTGYALLFDFGQMLVRHNPSFQETAPPLIEQGLLWRSLTMFMFAITGAPLLIIGFNLIPSLIFVGSGFSEPSEWPHLFGSVFEAYTVHNFWSRSWHQLLRRKFASHGKYLAHNILHLAPRSKASCYVQVCVAFFLSGLLHTRSRSDGRAVHFFLLQAVAIVFENIVFSLLQRLGLEARLRTFSWLGFVWVWCWFLYSFPLYWECMLHTGMFDIGRNLSFLISPSRSDWLLGN